MELLIHILVYYIANKKTANGSLKSFDIFLTLLFFLIKKKNPGTNTNFYLFMRLSRVLFLGKIKLVIDLQ